MIKRKKRKLTDYIKDLTTAKINLHFVNDEYLKDYAPVAINKMLSMNFKTYQYLLEINTYAFASMSKEAHFRYLHASLPKQYLNINYVKGKKNTALDDINNISKYYCCSRREAKGHYELLSKEQLKHIRNLYKSRS